MGYVKNRLKMNGLLYSKKSVNGSLWEKYSHIENRISEKSGVEVDTADLFVSYRRFQSTEKAQLGLSWALVHAIGLFVGLKPGILGDFYTVG